MKKWLFTLLVSCLCVGQSFGQEEISLNEQLLALKEQREQLTTKEQAAKRKVLVAQIELEMVLMQIASSDSMIEALENQSTDNNSNPNANEEIVSGFVDIYLRLVPLSMRVMEESITEESLDNLSLGQLEEFHGQLVLLRELAGPRNFEEFQAFFEILQNNRF